MAEGEPEAPKKGKFSIRSLVERVPKRGSMITLGVLVGGGVLAYVGYNSFYNGTGSLA